MDSALDVGANVGQFGLSLRNRGYAGQIMSFEPVSDAFNELKKVASGDDLWGMSNLALGAARASMEINVSENSQFSSFNDLTSTASNFDPEAAFKASESVIVETLDRVINLEDRKANVLLKIDTQGYERQVLEGGREALKHVRGVLLELPIINIYKGNWTFHEAVAYMRASGFALAQVHPVNVHGKAQDSVVEFDCLFRPVDPAID